MAWRAHVSPVFPSFAIRETFLKTRYCKLVYFFIGVTEQAHYQSHPNPTVRWFLRSLIIVLL